MIDKTILLVDDNKTNIKALLNLLENYDLIVALDGKKALEIASKQHIDLILLDIVMPEMDGYEVCKKLKENRKTASIPVIFATAKTDEESIKKAYEVGGVDYITKPFKAVELLSRIKTQLLLSEQKFMLESLVKEKTKELRDVNKELEETQKDIIFTLGVIGERRSNETANHVKRVAAYSELFAEKYGLSEKEVKLLKDASPMHDIGKVGIKDEILNKPGKLSPEEFEQMKKHTIYGYELLNHSKRNLLKAACIIAYEHHEKWDGSGYPRGLSKDNIHIFGRITAIADVFDALGSDRVYKKAWPDNKVFTYIKEQSGKHFEPKLVDIFFENLDEFLKIRDNFKDN